MATVTNSSKHGVAIGAVKNHFLSREVKDAISGTIYGIICGGTRAHLGVESVSVKGENSEILIKDSKNSIILISNQTRKWRVLIGLCLGSGAIMILAIIVLFIDFRLSNLLLSLAGENVWSALCFFGMITAFIAMICLCLMIKCPRCKLRWFWHAIAKDHKRNIAIDYMSHCPRCNYPDEESKDVKPTFKSQKPILEVSNKKNKFRNLWRAFFAVTAVMLLGIVGIRGSRNSVLQIQLHHQQLPGQR